MEAGKKRLAGDTARAANTDELKELRREAKDLKEVVAEQTLELRLLKKSMLGLGRLRLRGPCGASDEFLLAATAQNLRKLAKIFPAPQQTRKA